MSGVLLDNVRVLQPSEGIIGRCLLIEDGRIAEIDPSALSADRQRIDGRGRLLTPGLIDLHTHGIGEHLFEAGPEALRSGLELLPSFGVTCVLPTLYRLADPSIVAHLRVLSEVLAADLPVRVPGFHLEGPFLALPGAGAATVPGDLGRLDALLQAAASRVAAMSVSPDTPGILPVIRRLAEQGIFTMLTHTRATVEQTMAAIDAGARHATHFYDVFPLPPECEPGVRPCGAVEAILADPRVSVDFIADGVHVHPVAIRAALAAKGVSRVLLITDSNIGAGLPPGTHATPWGYPVCVEAGRGARVHEPGSSRHGVLAGSALTMDAGMSNLLRWLDLPEQDVWAMGTASVADRLGLGDLGRIRPGAPADLVLWDRTPAGDLQAAATWVGGRLVYSRSKEITA